MSAKLMSQAARRVELPLSHRLLLVLMADHANPDGITWVSSLTLAHEAGLHRRTVQRYRGQLRDWGYIVLVAGLNGGRNVSTRYVVCPTMGRHPARKTMASKAILTPPKLWPHDAIVSEPETMAEDATLSESQSMASHTQYYGVATPPDSLRTVEKSLVATPPHITALQDSTSSQAETPARDTAPDRPTSPPPGAGRSTEPINDWISAADAAKLAVEMVTENRPNGRDHDPPDFEPVNPDCWTEPGPSSEEIPL